MNVTEEVFQNADEPPAPKAAVTSRAAPHAERNVLLFRNVDTTAPVYAGVSKFSAERMDPFELFLLERAMDRAEEGDPGIGWSPEPWEDWPRVLTTADWAADYPKNGLAVFPVYGIFEKDGKRTCYCGRADCAPKNAGKHPKTKHGFKNAIADEAKVRHHFECYPADNIAIATGGVVVLDIDPRNGGDASLRELEQQHGALPATWRARTGGGGLHFYFAPPEGDVEFKAELAPGIDIKGKGGYVLAAPSLHVSGKRYEWDVAPGDVPLAPMPQWAVELGRKGTRNSASSSDSADPFVAYAAVEKLAPVERVRRALAVIPNTSDSWDDWNRIGMAIWSATGGSSEGLDCFLEWSGKYHGFSEPNTRERWGKYFTSPPNQIGAGTLFRLASEVDPHWDDAAEDLKPDQETADEALVDRDEDPADWVPNGDVVDQSDEDEASKEKKSAPEAKIPRYVERLNREYAVVLMKDQVLILHEEKDEVAFVPVEQFHLWHANKRVKVGDKWVPASRLWLCHPHRREYRKVVFDPCDTNPGHFNFWRGFSVKPDPTKSCEKFLAHVHDNICSGNEEHYQWVLGFLAHLVQKPGEKLGVSLVLRGEEGVGKGKFFARIAGELCKRHYVVIEKVEQLTGRFNAHIQTALTIFVDEGFWAGDKASQGALYHLVTDEDLLIEGKFKNAYMVRNLSRLIIASNEKWVVPAGLKARRWAVLDVSNAKARNREYFAAIEKEIFEDGGLAGLMHHLMTFDLSQVDVYTPPMTQGLLEQKEESFAPHVSWWCEVLQRGTFRYPAANGEYNEHWKFQSPVENQGNADVRGGVNETRRWPDKIKKDLVWESYKLWMKEHNHRSRLMPTQVLHQWLSGSKLLPGATTIRIGSNPRQLVLPGLTECREAFDSYIGQPRDWSGDDGPETEF